MSWEGKEHTKGLEVRSRRKETGAAMVARLRGRGRKRLEGSGHGARQERWTKRLLCPLHPQGASGENSLGGRGHRGSENRSLPMMSSIQRGNGVWPALKGYITAKLLSSIRPPPSKLWDSQSLARPNWRGEAREAGLCLLFPAD